MQTKQNDIALVWFRNDLRVQDNTVLKAALKNHQNVIACYCFDPRHYRTNSFGFKKTETYRAQFIIESITDLKSNLNELHIELFTYNDFPENAIPKLIDVFEITTIYLQKEWTSEEAEVLDKLKAALKDTVEIKSFFDQFLYHPDDINISWSQIPQIFTNFRKALEKNCSIRASTQNELADVNVEIDNTTTIPSLGDLGFEPFETHPHSAFPFKGGETSARARLENYFFETKKLGVYKKTRNGLIGTDYSSKFSAWLANGCISARSIFWHVKRFEKEHFKNESTYWLIFELIWRDYFKYISLKHQNDIFKIGGILHKDYNWKDDEHLINKWINGETTSAFVNANMIELKKTGWMSNRGRQNVASFFAKDLHLDWRIGASYFEALLIDYDVHSNYGNWMYVAGVGNDPRDRKFNVDLQAQRYDAQHKFRNLWLQQTLF